MAESVSRAKAQPYIAKVSSLTLAQCLVGMGKRTRKNARGSLSEAARLLLQIDVKVVEQLPGIANLAAIAALTTAPLDRLLGRNNLATQGASRAAASSDRSNADSYERAQLASSETSLPH